MAIEPVGLVDAAQYVLDVSGVGTTLDSRVPGRGAGQRRRELGRPSGVEFARGQAEVVAGGRLDAEQPGTELHHVEVELQDPEGVPLPGFSLDECEPVFCDSLDYTVRWRSDLGADLRPLAGQPVRLRFRLRDADVYSFQFVPFRPAPPRPDGL